MSSQLKIVSIEHHLRQRFPSDNKKRIKRNILTFAKETKSVRKISDPKLSLLVLRKGKEDP